MPVQRASINGGQAGTGGCFHGLEEKATLFCSPESSSTSWGGGVRHLGDQATQKEGASPMFGFCVGKGCWGWEEVVSPVVRVFNTLRLAVRGARQAVCWALSPG